jgi:DNA-binding transcriptional MerR regulator
MNHQRHNMLSIGSFANASGLSLKALRLYAQLNILAPSFVDPDSGYRYYAPDQLTVARRIRLMRQMEMPLATIRQVLAAAPADAERLVRVYWQMRETRMELDRQVVQTLVLNLRQEATAMTLEVQVKNVDPQPIISITSRVKVEQLNNHIVSSLDTLFALAKANGVAPAGPPLGIYHGPVNHEEDGPMEVVLPVQRALTATGDAKFRELSGGTVASVMMHGDQCEFPAILAGYDAVFDWVRQQGYEATEPPREIWHSEPGANAQMEIELPFREATGA